MSISSGSSDEQERRPFFGSVKPKADNFPGPRYPVTHPLTQANFVGVFTVLTIVIYTAVLRHFGQHAHLPPGKFYFALACALAVSWISLYIEAVLMMSMVLGLAMRTGESLARRRTGGLLRLNNTRMSSHTILEL